MFTGDSCIYKRILMFLLQGACDLTILLACYSKQQITGQLMRTCCGILLQSLQNHWKFYQIYIFISRNIYKYFLFIYI